jgi:RNA polymerase sigma-70 factor (ECF subfamily)
MLAQALARLPDDKRELLVLARYQALDYAAIGELLGCSAGAVKVRVHRAVGELRRFYLEVEKGGPR